MIRIYQTSDLHDRREIVEPLRRHRARRPGLLVDCGDALRGSQTVYHRREPIAQTLAAAGYDASAMGNREFHYLFGCVRRRLRAMRQPVLCANLVDLRGRPLPFRPDVVLRAPDGTPVRFFGLLVPQYATGSRWERVFGWRFLDPVAQARRIAAETPPGTVLVALSHLGLDADRSLAASVPRLDLILGGHSHDVLPQPLVVAGVPIVHAGPYGAFVSRTELVPDAAGGRARLEGFALVPLAGDPPDD